MNIFKLAGEKFKSAPKKEQKKICIASFLTVVAAVICVTFLFWNEICYFISPSWHLGHLANKTIHKINEEQGYISKKLFGVDITEDAYHIELSATAYQNKQKQSAALSVAPSENSVDIAFTTAKNDVPILQTLTQWNDSDIAFSAPQINNNRYYIPTQDFRDTPFTKSLPVTIPEHIDSLAYTKLMHTDQNTKDVANHAFKQFIKKLEYGKREKASMDLYGKTCSVHLIRTKCEPESLSEFASSLYLLYTDGVLKDTSISRAFSDICETLKENAKGEPFDLDLIERGGYLIGFKTDAYTVYFHSGLLLNGFTVELPDVSYTIDGDIQFGGGVMDFELIRSTSPEESEKLAGVYLYRRAKKLLFDLPFGVFSLNVQCANSEQTFAVFENMVPYNNDYVDLTLCVKPDKPEIAVGTEDVLLTDKTLDQWKNEIHPSINRLLRKTSVFSFLTQK